MIYIPTNEDMAKGLGWLGEDGICTFPRDVQAVPTGYKAPGLNFEKMTPAMIDKAVEKGWIRFIDGAGAEHRFADYCALYPEYPDPIFCLTMQGRWPPTHGKDVREAAHGR